MYVFTTFDVSTTFTINQLINFDRFYFNGRLNNCGYFKSKPYHDINEVLLILSICFYSNCG